MFQVFSMALVMCDYWLRTESYAALCVNKDKPEMHCEGHCQMAKKMQEENNNDQNNPQTQIEISLVYFVTDFPSPEITAPVLTDEEKTFPVFQEPVTYQQPKGIFRPPAIT